MTPARRRRLRAVVALLALAAVCAATFAVRRPILRGLGRALVAEDPIEPADIIVVATGADGAGVLEAADLVQRGVAGRVAIFADPPDAVDEEFLRRGVPYEDAAARAVRQLGTLGVASVEQIPRAVTGTEDEGRALPGWCDHHGFRAVVVVTTADHSRRLRRVLRRSMRGHATRVTVRAARYSPFDPDRWWRSREGTRVEIIELQKLCLEIARHPFS